MGELVNPEWRVTTCLWIQSGGLKVRDTHAPTSLQIRSLGEYLDHKVAFEDAKFCWVTGFTKVSDPSVSYQNNDDVCIQAPGYALWYGRIYQSLVAVVEGKVYFFSFIWWYDEAEEVPDGRVPPAGFILLKKWEENGEHNVPVSPVCFVERVLVQHWCVRTCNRSPPCARPLTCNCNVKCKLAAYCATHQRVRCHLCRGTDANVDYHHAGIGLYIAADSAHGFRPEL